MTGADEGTAPGADVPAAAAPSGRRRSRIGLPRAGFGPDGDMTNPFAAALGLMLAGVAVVVVGLFLPWTTAEGRFDDPAGLIETEIYEDALGGEAEGLLAGLGAVVAVGGLFLGRPGRWASVAGVVLVAVVASRNILDVRTTDLDGAVAVRVGIGLWLVTTGAVLLVAGRALVAVLLRRASDRPAGTEAVPTG